MSRASILADGGLLAAGRPYAERAEASPSIPDIMAEALVGALVRPLRNRMRDPVRALRRVVAEVDRHDHSLRARSDSDLLDHARVMRARLRRDGFALEPVGACFALVREAASRTLGMRHFETQLMAGWALVQGRLAEMATGEGKTFAATLAACTVALAGPPVHIITVNDYLAQRDAHEMEPLYRFLGLSVGTVIQGMQRADKRQAYARSVVYCTNKELAFDYLRDRVTLAHKSSQLHLALERLHGSAGRAEDLVLRGLHFGIVDEADSVFIDEARTPLILSAPTGPADEAELCERALSLARGLTVGEDYQISLADRSATLTHAGGETIAGQVGEAHGLWTSARAREELVAQALIAVHLYHRDLHYVVAEGAIQIVDESTGRVMPDRSWERGLHQLIEVKEGCAPTQRRETIARLTYQRLFRRYLRLSGMTGTGREVAREIRAVYALDVVRIPLHRPTRRRMESVQILATRAEKWRAVADTVTRLSVEAGRPVLIGTRSVGASEEISAVLSARGIEHALLNAKQDHDEADVIAAAGQAARVTVATNMAGRGTDIRLDDGVAGRGGLHVILTEYHDSRRIDRQLFGRCARQGNPGSCQAIVSLEDELYAVYAPAATRLLRRVAGSTDRLPNLLHALLRRWAQEAAERRGAELRMQNLKTDRRMDQVLAFSGRGE